MRDLLFKDFFAAMNIYEKTFEARTEPEDASVPLRFDYSFVDETQTISSETQLNAALNSQEILETDNKSVHEFIESAHVDSLTTTQKSSLFNVNNEKREIMIDSLTSSGSSRTSEEASRSLHTLTAA